jgi:hypothetical protein
VYIIYFRWTFGWIRLIRKRNNERNATSYEISAMKMLVWDRKMRDRTIGRERDAK